MRLGKTSRPNMPSSTCMCVCVQSPLYGSAELEVDGLRSKESVCGLPRCSSISAPRVSWPVYPYVCVRVYICVYVYVCIFLCMYACRYVCMYVCIMCVCMYSCPCVHTDDSMRRYATHGLARGIARNMAHCHAMTEVWAPTSAGLSRKRY
jgi:hypothetical protein